MSPMQTPFDVRYPIRLPGGRMAWIEVPDTLYESDKKKIQEQLAIIGTSEDEWILDVYQWIDSTCPPGSADEAFRVAPQAIKDSLHSAHHKKDKDEPA